MNNNYTPGFNRFDVVFVPSYIELSCEYWSLQIHALVEGLIEATLAMSYETASKTVHNKEGINW